jgi:Zn-dependent M28 family amino/carboxypeptidase
MAAAALLCAQQGSVPSMAGMPPAVRATANSIDAEKIRAHVRFLASDLLEGRGPGTRGGEIAAEYIATQFALDGLKPAGENGTYFQKVPLYAVHTIEDQTRMTLVPEHGAEIDLAYSRDVVTKDETGQDLATIDAPIVFVGYGIDAPEYGWNDYAGVDVRGKVVLAIISEPPSNDLKFFNGPALTYYGRPTYKYEEAARRGAVGVLLIHRLDLATFGWDVLRNSQAIEKSYLEGDPTATLRAASWISADASAKLMAAAGLDFSREIEAAGRRGFRARELPVRLKATIASRVRQYVSANVIGEVPGTEGGPDQAVIYTAHYDHLGIDPDLRGHNIFNGAADNGTGCGILLELARAWAEVRPPHTVFLASVTAEEQGMLGSQYLGTHLPIPAAQIALDLNYDMLIPIGVPRSVEVSGAERTTFYSAVERTAHAFDLAIQPDAFPRAGYYYRSDHFSFARVGIPAFSIQQGTLFVGHDDAWGVAQEEDYNEHRYHRPWDQYRPEMDFRGDAKMAQFGFVLGWEAMTAKGGIGWKPGDELADARKKSLASGH